MEHLQLGPRWETGYSPHLPAQWKIGEGDCDYDCSREMGDIPKITPSPIDSSQLFPDKGVKFKNVIKALQSHDSY